MVDQEFLRRGLEPGLDRELERIGGAGQASAGPASADPGAPPAAGAPPAVDGAMDPTVPPHDAATSTVLARAIDRDRASGVRMTVPSELPASGSPYAVWQG